MRSLFVLFLTLRGAQPVWPDAAEADLISVYRTLTKPAGQQHLSERQMLVTRLIKAGGLARSVDMPIKRAKVSYRHDPKGCITMQLATMNSFEIESAPLEWFPIWMYVRGDFRGNKYEDIKTAVTFGGGNYEQFLIPFRHVSWEFSQSYEAMIALVKNGEVDGVILGEAGVEGFAQGDDQLRPLSTEPITRIASRVRCKNTPETRRFITDLNERLASK